MYGFAVITSASGLFASRVLSAGFRSRASRLKVCALMSMPAATEVARIVPPSPWANAVSSAMIATCR